MRQLFVRIPFFDWVEHRDFSEKSKITSKTVNGSTLLVAQFKIDLKHKKTWYEFEKFILYGDGKYRFSPVVDPNVVGNVGKAFVCRFAPNSALYLVRAASGEVNILVAHHFKQALKCDPVVLWSELISELPIKNFPLRVNF